MTPTTSAAITDQVHNSRMSCDCLVIPSGQPKRQNVLFGVVHPVRVTTPRRPSAASRASLLPRATARCLLVLRPALRTVLPAVRSPFPPCGFPADHSVGRD